MHLAATLAVAVVDSGCKRSVKCDEMCKPLGFCVLEVLVARTIEF